MEGLRYGHHVTIDDAGPVFEARIDNLQAVLGAHRRIVAFDADEMPTTAANWLIAMGDMPRVVVARGHALGRTLHLAPAVRDSLGLADGDTRLQSLYHFTLGLPVAESNNADFNNFPKDHPLYQGFETGSLLKEADLVLVLDCDVPWIPLFNRPSNAAKIVHIDVDPINVL